MRFLRKANAGLKSNSSCLNEFRNSTHINNQQFFAPIMTWQITYYDVTIANSSCIVLVRSSKSVCEKVFCSGEYMKLKLTNICSFNFHYILIVNRTFIIYRLVLRKAFKALAGFSFTIQESLCNCKQFFLVKIKFKLFFVLFFYK